MKVTVVVENNENDDGINSVVTYTQEIEPFVEDFLFVCGKAMQASGFTYVGNLVAVSDQDDNSWKVVV